MSWQLAVTGWTKNPDERVLMREILQRLLLTNLSVFYGLGLAQVEFSFQDVDLIGGEYPAPVYQVAGTFTCMAAAVVRDSVDEVIDVHVTATSI